MGFFSNRAYTPAEMHKIQIHAQELFRGVNIAMQNYVAQHSIAYGAYGIEKVDPYGQKRTTNYNKAALKLLERAKKEYQKRRTNYFNYCANHRLTVDRTVFPVDPCKR